MLSILFFVYAALRYIYRHIVIELVADNGIRLFAFAFAIRCVCLCVYYFLFAVFVLCLVRVFVSFAFHTFNSIRDQRRIETPFK